MTSFSRRWKFIIWWSCHMPFWLQNSTHYYRYGYKTLALFIGQRWKLKILLWHKRLSFKTFNEALEYAVASQTHLKVRMAIVREANGEYQAYGYSVIEKEGKEDKVIALLREIFYQDYLNAPY